MSSLPTCDIENFQKHLDNPNVSFNKEIASYQTRKLAKIDKNVIFSFCQGAGGCDFIRNRFWMEYLYAVYAKPIVKGQPPPLRPIVLPFFNFAHEWLMRTRSIFIPRVMNPALLPPIEKYAKMRDKYGYKLIYDLDDYIWGKDPGKIWTDESKCQEYNAGSYEIPFEHTQIADKMMNLCDTVTTTTPFLAKQIHDSAGVPMEKIKLLPNSVPAFFYGRERRKPITERIKKPKVIFTGSPAHYNNEKRLLGDFDNVWKNWLLKSIAEDKIEFRCMGLLPFFLEPVKDKIDFVHWLNSYQYHLPIQEFQPHFSIGPLVPNCFNYSKSDIRAKESYAYGAIFIGTVFSNGKPSPYDKCFVRMQDDCSVEDIDKVIDQLCETLYFNKIINSQYDWMDDNGGWLESEQFVNLLLSIF